MKCGPAAGLLITMEYTLLKNSTRGPKGSRVDVDEITARQLAVNGIVDIGEPVRKTAVVSDMLGNVATVEVADEQPIRRGRRKAQ